MKTKIRRTFTNNIGLKILALIFAFLLWLAVVNIDDPTQTRTFTAVVKVTNEQILTKAGKLYQIKDGINTVSFRVTAKRSIIGKLSSSDFTAIADMQYLESEERVPVTISANSYANYITISSKQNYLYVELQDEVAERFMINPKTVGNPAPGVALISVNSSPTVITIAGTDELVKKVARVDAICNIEGQSADFTENVILKLYDSKGNEIDATGLSMSSTTVDVSVDFANMKSVDINVKSSGVLPLGLTLGTITAEPGTILVKGETAALNDLSSITIPDSVIDLSNATGSYSTVVDVSPYLPEGVTIADGCDSKTTIFVKMEGDESLELQIPSKNIVFHNLADGLKATINSEMLNVNVFGLPELLSELTGNSVVGVIDCTGLGPGENQSVVAHLTAPEGVAVQNMTVSVDIAESNPAEHDSVESKEE